MDTTLNSGRHHGKVDHYPSQANARAFAKAQLSNGTGVLPGASTRKAGRAANAENGASGDANETARFARTASADCALSDDADRQGSDFKRGFRHYGKSV